MSDRSERVDWEDPGAVARELLADPRRVAVDTVAPTVLFAVVATQRGVVPAATAALGLCAVVFAYRLIRRQGLLHAASGLGGVLVGVVVALASGDAEGFFLPGILANAAFGVLCVASVVVRRPLLAHATATLFRWPLEWHWHPRVRPAYAEVTLLWAAYYVGKGVWQYLLAIDGRLALLTTVRLLTGWPTLVVLVAVTYVYLNWRLSRLGGPTVEAYQAEGGADPDATDADEG